MTVGEKQILESIRAMPLDARKELLRKAIREELNDSINENGRNASIFQDREDRFERARAWIYVHKDEYDGEFVLLEGDKLLGHGADPKALYEKARKLKIQSPYVTRIKARELPFGGW